MKLPKIWKFISFLTLLVFFSCNLQNEEQSKSSSSPLNPLSESLPLAGSFENLELTSGQTIFVPAYIGIYNSDTHKISLTTTISIHNTDSEDSIIVRSVEYYGGKGKLIREYAQTPVRLGPMATTTFFVERANLQEGLGANFIIKWAAEKRVYEPVVEAVMIGSLGTQGFSFLSPGRVLSQK